jgi:hypothetical protein
MLVEAVRASTKTRLDDRLELVGVRPLDQLGRRELLASKNDQIRVVQ